jgi:hypothetical protein
VVVLGLSAVLLMFFVSDAFYVHSIGVGGLTYMTKEEVFALTDIANLHLFWVDPEAVRQAVMRSPTVADATVIVGWPPEMVRIIIEEREPALVWVQSGVATWIDLQGRVMRQRQDRTDLLRITVDGVEGPLGPNVRIDEAIVVGALQLRTILPLDLSLRYDPLKGLGYKDERGWDVWLGSGTDMPEKMLIYRALADSLLARGIQPGEINVANRHAPYYSALWGR